MTNKEYKYLNFSILVVLATVFICPILVTKFGINLKNCSGKLDCVSCGITRDFYSIVTLDNKSNFINNHSIFIFIVLVGNILFRLYINFEFKSNFLYNKIKKIDCTFSILSLFLLYILFNIKF